MQRLTCSLALTCCLLASSLDHVSAGVHLADDLERKISSLARVRFEGTADWWIGSIKPHDASRGLGWRGSWEFCPVALDADATDCIRAADATYRPRLGFRYTDTDWLKWQGGPAICFMEQDSEYFPFGGCSIIPEGWGREISLAIAWAEEHPHWLFAPEDLLRTTSNRALRMLLYRRLYKGLALTPELVRYAMESAEHEELAVVALLTSLAVHRTEPIVDAQDVIAALPDSFERFEWVWAGVGASGTCRRSSGDGTRQVVRLDRPICAAIAQRVKDGLDAARKARYWNKGGSVWLNSDSSPQLDAGE